MYGRFYGGGPLFADVERHFPPPLPPPGEYDHCIVMNTDSSRRGMGAWHGDEWWMMEWPRERQCDAAPSMTWLELIPVMVACLVWGGAYEHL